MIVVLVRWDKAELPPEALAVIREIATNAEVEVRPLMSSLPEEIALRVGHGPRFIPETDELGASVATGLVVWTVNTARLDDVASIARSSLRQTLFHEFHHLAGGWVMRRGARTSHFIEGPVSEGLATAFEQDEAKWEPPWGVYPDRDTAEKWVHELLSQTSGADCREWMFLHPDARRWTGYKAGTFIADQATMATGMSPADLARTPASEVLVMAGFA